MLGPAQAAGDRGPRNAAVVGNPDAVAARPGQRAEALGAAMQEFEPLRQSICARQLEAGAAGLLIDHAAVNGHHLGAEQNLSDPGDQPLGLKPERSSLVGTAHVQLCAALYKCTGFYSPA